MIYKILCLLLYFFKVKLNKSLYLELRFIINKFLIIGKIYLFFLLYYYYSNKLKLIFFGKKSSLLYLV